MAKRKTTKKPERNNKAKEIRLKVTNWDKEVPVMTKKQADRPSNRKVVTKGIVRSNENRISPREDDLATELLDIILLALRNGYEYRLVNDDNEDAVRFIPCVEKDMKTVSIIAQTTGSFRGSLNDKEVKPFYRGEEISRTKAAKMVAEAQKDDAEYKRSRVNVSPDMVVTCPKCGTEFRVGKELK